MDIRLFGNVPPFGKKPQGIDTSCKIEIIGENENLLHAAIITSGSLQKGRLYVYLYELFPKVVIHLLVPFACGIRDLHATQIRFCSEKLNKFKNGATFKNFMNPSAIFILIKAYPSMPLSGQSNF
jgi:hypothetical protein